MTAGPWQILICIVIVLVLFGGKKIPELARSLGKAKSEFKKGLSEGAKEDDEVPSEEPKKLEKEA
ncbi:MAG: twin-arginine translocase TatA/TatE family subunit [Kiritimatiellae bacterium]|jgi:sec-independent protein translocase protein TatA|nr:twin-arginine translocase TatA/TatE family subunit [Kiritimatiellia bacterium]